MSAAALDYPLPRPALGEPVPVAGGVRWLRLPLPFALDHINLWLLDGAAGERVLVDTGVDSPDNRAHWQGLLEAWSPGRIVVTHFHPDHMGLARWLQAATGAVVWMTRAERDTAERLLASSDDEAGGSVAAFYRRHGLDAGRADALRRRGNTYSPLVDGMPEIGCCIADGDTLDLAGADWRVIVGRGHAPEHACLYRAGDGVLIAGDQLLPRISSNVSVPPAAPDADPLGAFLDSLDTLDTLPADTLVLPSHGRPFRGLHARTAELRAHHEHHLAVLLAEARRRPLTAADALPLLFDRSLDSHSLFFAMGEAVAHLNRLWHTGAVARRERDGVWAFTAP